MIEPTETRMMIVDGHETVRHGIMEIVDRAQGLMAVTEANSVNRALSRAELANPNVVLVDLQLPGDARVDLTGQLRTLVSESRCTILTSFDDDAASAEPLEVGAAAYLLKTAAGVGVVDIIKTVAAGRMLLDERTVTRPSSKHVNSTKSLTSTKRKILNSIEDGLSNRGIDKPLRVAGKTVKNHITALLPKVGLQRRIQMVAWMAF